ncbi:MAG: DUF4058 family protein [Chloroflexi bacterium]|nr:DUF4058 family protein [Chloroflexota bacterium]
METQYPFPGMDPYLEAPDIWPDFHDRLAAAVSAILNDDLPEPYYARLQMRSELGVVLESGISHTIIPDILIARYPTATPPPTEGGVAVLERPRTRVSPGIDLQVHHDPIRHPFIEIRDAARGHKLITLIEIVSPTNKRPGPDRRSYETKQREVLESDANLIELDLLRSGMRLIPREVEIVVAELKCDYLVTVNRSATRESNSMGYTLYPVKLRDALPCIPVPLAGQDPDVPLDLQICVQRAHREGPYLRAVDYSQPPAPPVSDDDAIWLDARLKNARLRS